MSILFWVCFVVLLLAWSWLYNPHSVNPSPDLPPRPPGQRQPTSHEQPAEWSPSAATQPPESQALASDSSFSSGSVVAVQNTKTKKQFPNLVFLAEIFRTIAIVCVVIGGLIAGLCVFLCVESAAVAENFLDPLVPLIIGVANLLAFMVVAMLYRAFAEMIYLALYAATLLEDIRNK